jgi:hypothetical protein
MNAQIKMVLMVLVALILYDLVVKKLVSSINV